MTSSEQNFSGFLKKVNIDSFLDECESHFPLFSEDENDFKELLKDKKAGKLKFINSDEMWASIDKTIAKYE